MPEPLETGRAVRHETSSWPPAARPDLFVGRVLSHYRLEQPLGAGGMGVVYKATDLKLGRAVAIKLLSRQLAADEAAKARFVREARAASALDHPNIGAIYDIGEQDGELFIVMALYEGQTLRQRLQEGALPPEEATQVLAQVAKGLEAAHRAGIIHRDIKPANVMLGQSGAVKILDFGVAKLMADSTAQSTQAGEVMGTLLYMSPEQLRGESVDHRSDLWSLGVVAYECLSGVCPFRADSNAAVAVRILTEQPPSLANIPCVPAWLAELVTQLLQKGVAKRLGGASEVVARIDQQTQRAVAPVRHMSRLPMVFAALALLIAAGVAAWMVRSLTARKLDSVARHRKRQAVAVLGFKDLAQHPDTAWIATALSEMLTSELGVGERLRLIPGESVARLKSELNLTDGQTYGADTLNRIRKLVDVDFVVYGSYVLIGEGRKLRIDYRLQDAAGAKTLTALSDSGTEIDMLDIVSRVGNQLRRRLGIKETSEGDAEIVRASLPSNPEAARLYSEGLTKLRALDVLAARSLLERAIAVAPEHALAHSALASAWSELGYDEKARQEARNAFELSTNLSREDKLSVEAWYRAMNAEWNKAVEIYRTLYGFFPDNLDYGLRLVAAQTSAGKGHDSFATVEALRKLSPPAGQDPRIDLAEGRAAESVSDFKRAQASAVKAATRGKELGAPLLTAQALNDEGFAFYNLGETTKAAAAYEQSRQMFTAAGNKGGMARASHGIGLVLQLQGDNAHAQKVFEEALAIRREIGNQKGAASSLSEIAIILRHKGDLAEAKKLLEESLAIRREIGDKRGIAPTLSNIANILDDQGDLAGALESYQESLAVDRDLDNKKGQAVTLCNVAMELRKKGDLAEAKRMDKQSLVISREIGAKAVQVCGLMGLGNDLADEGDLRGALQSDQQALTLSKEIGNRAYQARALSDLGELLYMEGNLAEARRNQEDALSISNGIGDKGNAAAARVSLSELLTELGSFSEAEDLARQTAEEFRGERASHRQAKAENALARALLLQGRFAEAHSAVARALGLLSKSQNRKSRFSVAITDARVQAALRKASSSPGAERVLEGIITESKKAGFIDYQLEARLALGEIQMKSGNTSIGRRQLQQVERDAKAKGYGLIARKAAAAQGIP